MISLKNIYTVAGVGAIMCLSASCNKLLDQDPKNSTYKEVFWEDPRAGASAVAGNYALLRDVTSTGLYGSNHRYYSYGETAAGLGYTRRGGDDGQGNLQIEQGTFEHNYVAAALGDWTGYYKVIAQSNTILKEMAAVPDEVLASMANPEAYRNHVLGQALFVRALTYFMLVRTWGDVPLVTEAYDDPIKAPHLGRSPKLEVMAQIEKDCKEAYDYLTWNYYSSGEIAVTANKGAVNALLAHLYLWRATVSNVQSDLPDMADVDKAALAISEIETQGNYRLTDTASYQQTFIGRSTESIFEINKSEDTQEGTTQHFARLFVSAAYSDVSYFSVNPFYFVKPDYLNSHYYKWVEKWDWHWDPPGQWVWRPSLVKERDDKDVRYRKNFYDATGSYPQAVKYSNISFRNPSQKLDAHFSNNMNIFRLSDMLLLKAEIALYKDQLPVAIEIINNFRKRNNADPSSYIAANATKAVVMTGYIEERAKELFMEGHIFYDLVRTRKCFDVIPWLTEQRFRRQGFYWPVAPALFKENRYLIQTEFWRGKI